MLKRLSDNIYYLEFSNETDRPNLGYVMGSSRALMYDAGASPSHTEKYNRAVDQFGFCRPDFSVISHWHWDHSFGAASLNIPVIAGSWTNRQLMKMKSWKWDRLSMQQRVENGEDILFCTSMAEKEYGDTAKITIRTADIVFDDEMVLDLGGLTCHLIRTGGPHSEDSVVCYIPEEKILLLGDSAGKDLMQEAWEFDPQHPERLEAAIDALPYDPVRLDRFRKRIGELDFTVCLLGHSPPMERKELLDMLA